MSSLEPAVSLPAVALGHAWEWSRVVAVQMERFLRTGSVADTYLLVLALRNVLRAAELARDHALSTEAGRESVDRAIAAFEQELPGVRSARDALEHFDEYARGRGGRPGGRGAQGPYFARIDGSGDADPATGLPDQLVLRIGPHEVVLTTAPTASAALVHAVYEASRREERGGA